jgi:hypothetical protein
VKELHWLTFKGDTPTPMAVHADDSVDPLEINLEIFFYHKDYKMNQNFNIKTFVHRNAI